MRRICLPLLLFVLAGPTALATEVTDPIAGEAIWTVDQSPYQVIADVNIEADGSLVIEPGVTVEFAEGTSLIVHGELIARGSAEAPIVFTGVTEGGGVARWGSIVFADTSVDATFQALDDYVSGSILDQCIVEGASRGVTLEGASPYLHQSTFRSNRTPFSVDIEGGAGIYMKPGSAPRVRACHFEDNVADGFNYGGAIYADDSQPILQDNTFVNNQSIYGGAVSTNLMASPIVGNIFDGNAATGSGYSKGGGLSLVSSIPAVLNNTFTSNTSVLDGGGVHVCVDCFPHATPFFFDNTIAGNSAETDDPALGAGGLGAGYLRVVTDNNIHGNTRNSSPSDFGWYHPLEEGMPDWVSHRSIANNYWGTTDDAKISDQVTDGTDVDGVGTVDFGPVAEEPIASATPRITLTTRRLHYDEPGEPMPVYLTVYNPGAATDFELRVWLSYHGLRGMPLAQPLGLPDEIIQGSGHTFSMPENSVFFAEISTATYQGPNGLPNGRFVAVLYDAEGTVVGQVNSVRFDLLEEVTR